MLKQTRMMPYPPIFNKIPANMIDTGVGASTWASGNQVCSGTMGTLMAKAKKSTIKPIKRADIPNIS
ncbi:hypothetical protein D3C87_1306960 [compost metagenome]